VESPEALNTKKVAYPLVLLCPIIGIICEFYEKGQFIALFFIFYFAMPG